MPELPEVQTVVNELLPLLTGRKITAFQPYNKYAFINDFDVDGLNNLVIETVQRRAKYIIFKFKNNQIALIAHLRMTGKFVRTLTEKDEKHITAEINFEDASKIYFVDIRKFGGFSITDNIDEYFKTFGPEPFSDSLKANYLIEKFKISKRPIKSLLLDQKIISGIGNIYADEALFLAKIHPESLGFDLKNNEILKLRNAIITVIDSAIKNMGTTLSDYRNTDNFAGENQHYLMVYGQDKKECKNCKNIISKIVLAGRGTHFCPNCQKKRRNIEKN